MPRANLRKGRQAREIGAAIVETWLKLLPTPATILSVDSTVGNQLKITINRQIFTAAGQSINLRDSGGSTTTNLKVGTPSAVADFKQQLLIFLADGATPFPTAGDFTNGLAFSNVGSPSSHLKAELTAVLNQIVDGVTVEPEFDEAGKIYVVVPQIPEDILIRADLLDYLEKYHRFGQGRHYHDELGAAVLFGCR